MFYAALGVIMCVVWSGALLILPLLQQRELARGQAASDVHITA
jgi:hypothetical protein